MDYHLRFYVIPESAASQLPTEPAEVHAYVRHHGVPIGVLQFGPGESTLFLTAAENLANQPLLDLLQAPVGEVEPDDNHIFGGLFQEEAKLTLETLESVLRNVTAESAGIVELAEKHDFAPQRLLQLLNAFHSVLKKCLAAGGEIITLYE